jgi:PleD family two-component response regulator
MRFSPLSSAPIRDRSRDIDIAVCLGGGEFVVVPVATGVDPATTIADLRWQSVTDASFAAVPRPVTIRIGVARLARHADIGRFIARAAGALLLLATREGRNRGRICERVDSIPPAPTKRPDFPASV